MSDILHATTTYFQRIWYKVFGIEGMENFDEKHETITCVIKICNIPFVSVKPLTFNFK